jgi:uncharacterized protein YqgC (DUF456 family)
MDWLYYILLLLVCVGGMALVVVTLPGLWLMTIAAAIYALLTKELFLGHKSLIALFLLALVAEILELTAGGAAAKKAGGSRRAAIGAFVGGIAGGIIGSFVLPLVLTIVGICIGSFVGAMLGEITVAREATQALRVGWGAAKGRLFGVLLKLGFGGVMFLIILIAAFPFPRPSSPPLQALPNSTRPTSDIRHRSYHLPLACAHIRLQLEIA